MKYVALLSGGKDSCFNLLHCDKNGHELIAAASLGPGAGKEELDSYLYQTVGQDAIEFVAQALEVPLYRRVITGTAIQQGSEYGSRKSKDPTSIKGDETEDLFALLSEVKAKHPDIQGVSVGAILSNYQRIRVEHVCRRLALTPLCYLWNRDQTELLNEMIESGMEAILIKVAGIGLTTKHLGKTLAQMQPILLRLNGLYGAHVCGEGGEYESLTLDCPLFKRRIVLEETETVIHSDNDFATVAFIRIKRATLEPKDVQPANVVIPPLLEEQFEWLQSDFSHINQQDTANKDIICSPAERSQDIELGVRSQKNGTWVSVCNIQRSSTGEISLEDEVKECFYNLEAKLVEHSLDLSHCANINIFLSSMDTFAAVNLVYGTFFGVGPPARACVAVDLPHHVRLRLDCTAFEDGTSLRRSSLHVQGLSYWAPASIGPYSQAISVEFFFKWVLSILRSLKAAQNIFISGQIGLIPAQLALPSPRSLARETALSLQHVHRVVNVLKQTSGSTWDSYGHEILTLYWFADARDLSPVKAALQRRPATRGPTLFLSVKSLPKDALVEKQVHVHTGLAEFKDEADDEPELRPVQPTFTRKKNNDSLLIESVHFEGAHEKYIVICGKGAAQASLEGLSAIVKDFSIDVLSARLFHDISSSVGLDGICKQAFGNAIPPITPIPCRKISTLCTAEWDFALCILQM